MAKSIKSNPEYQRAISQIALRKKYPQMYDKDGKLKPKYSGKGKKTDPVSRLKSKVKGYFASKKSDGPKRNLREKAIERQTGLPESELKKYR